MDFESNIVEDEILDDLKKVLSELYYKHGRDEEVIKLSQILDKLIVEKQIYYINRSKELKY